MKHTYTAKGIKTLIIGLSACLFSIFFIQHAGAEEQKITYSKFQLGFMTIVADYADLYKKSENQLQKSALVTERFQKFTKLDGDPKKIKDWYGVLEKMGTTSDGKAFVTIRLSPNMLTLSTWNNGFSDHQDRSLISQSSPIYKNLSSMKEGNVVKFSGRLKRLTNLTEAGKMLKPDFLFVFTDIVKVGDRAIP